MNNLGEIVLLCNPKGRSHDKYIASSHEYILGFSKNILPASNINIPKSLDEIQKNYKLSDSKGRYRQLELRNTHREFGKHNRENLYYPFFVDKEGNIILNSNETTEEVYPIWDDGFEGCWTWGKTKSESQIDELIARKVKGKWKIYRKGYALNDHGEATKKVKSIWHEPIFYTEKGQTIFNDLFQTKEKIFQAPKSVDTIVQLLQMGIKQNEIVLDFFAGSATTAHAVMQLNAEDGGNRKFIMVQLPEVTDEKSEAYKAGYKNIAEISKERIRRAGQQILESDNINENWNKDIGFRVLKTDESNMKDVFYKPQELSQLQLFDQVDNVKEDRNAEDLLFQIMLDWGLELSLPIHVENIQGKKVYFVADDALIACFDQDITEELVKELANKQPMRLLFRDNYYANNDVKINAGQLVKQLSPKTELKSI